MTIERVIIDVAARRVRQLPQPAGGESARYRARRNGHEAVERIVPTNVVGARSRRSPPYGVPEQAIARVVGVDPKTLRKHDRDELDLGATKATAKVAEFQFRKATTEGPQCVTARSSG